MARLWSSGFELQSTTNAVEFDTGTGTGAKSIDTTTKRSGAAALRVNSSANYWFMTHQYRASATSKVYVRMYLYIASLPDGPMSILGLSATSGGNTIGQIQLNTNGTLELSYYNGSYVQVGSDSSALNTGQWYRIELSADDADANNTISARIDGTEFASGNGNNLGGHGMIEIGSIFASQTFDLYFDDVAVNDGSGSAQTSWPGDGKIIHLKPNAAGDSNTWLKSDGGAGDNSNYQDVDEVTPDDATTYLKRTTTTIKVDDYNCGASGIGASDTVNVVSVGVRGKATSNTASNDRNILLRIKKTASGTVQKSGNIDYSTTAWETHGDPTPKVYQLTTYADPDAGAWTQSTLDTMQIGMETQTSATTEIDISTIWALVDYTPSTGTNYNETYTEVVTLVEALVRAPTRTLAEVVALVQTFVKQTSRVFAETAIVADIISKRPAKTPTETIALADTYGRTWTVVRAYNEAVVLADTLVRATTRTLGDVIAVVDTISTVFGKVLTETIALVDTIIRATGRTCAEAVTIVDAAVKSTSRSLVDALAIVDTVPKQVSRTWSEVATLADNTARLVVRTLSDALTVVDTFSRTWTLSRTYDEVVALVDIVMKYTQRSLAESVLIADIVAGFKITLKVLSETIVLADTITKDISRVMSEAVTIVDTFTRSASRMFTEAVTVADTIVRTVTRTIGEVVTLAETVARSMGRTLSETITNTDTLSRLAGKVHTEAVAISDTVSRSIGRALSETVSLTDVLDAIKDVAKSIGNFVLTSVYGLMRTFKAEPRAFTLATPKLTHTLTAPTEVTVSTQGERSYIIKLNE